MNICTFYTASYTGITTFKQFGCLSTFSKNFNEKKFNNVVLTAGLSVCVIFTMFFG